MPSFFSHNVLHLNIVFSRGSEVMRANTQIYIYIYIFYRRMFANSLISLFVACLIMFIPSELCLEFKQDVRQNRDRTTHFRGFLFFVLFFF